MANHEFEASMEIWEKLLNTVEKDTKGKPYKLTLKYCTQTEYSKEPCLAAVVTIVDDEILQKMGVLENDRLNDEKEELLMAQKTGGRKNKAITEWIQKITIERGKRQHSVSQFYEQVLTKSLKSNTAFMYVIKADQYIQGNLIPFDVPPTPPVSILDKNEQVSWDTKYTISKITDKNLIAETYRRFVNICLEKLFSRSVPKKYSSADEAVNDRDATSFQRLLRARQRKRSKRSKKMMLLRSKKRKM
ncbi:unnamed protein product [Ambrosiozyma monospora]|uniref:Unnamed protein product n=1 Tax=Ambrosiozyma monospora TaxID=43982 RepID=A0ACB5UAX8_AMBMO|nr:unnamed protein product [Ambrosiozyma monospora]